MANGLPPGFVLRRDVPPPPNLVSAVEWQESRGNPNAVSPKGARGPMQIMPATMVDPGFNVQPFNFSDPDPVAENRRMGKDYLGAMLQRYGGDEEAALVAYNWGPGNADKWVAGGRDQKKLPAETRSYVQNILGQQQGIQAPQMAQGGLPPGFVLRQRPAQSQTPPVSDAGATQANLALPPNGDDEWEASSLLPGAVNKRTGERRLATPKMLTNIGKLIETAVADPNSEEGARAITELSLIFSPSPAGKLGWAAKPAVTAPPRGTVATAAENIGVELPRAALGGRVKQNVARRLADIPVVGAPLERSSETAIGQIGQAAKKAEAGYGAGSIPRAGEAAREGLTSYIKNVSKESVGRQYDKVDELLDPSVKAPLPATTGVLVAINNARTAAAQGPSKAASLIDEATKRPDGLTYAGIKQLRTSIGELLDTGPLPTDISGGELKRIYAALTQDLKSAVQTAGGPKALAQFERANKYNTLVSANREKLATILGAKSDEAIVDRILSAAGSTARADIKLLGRARKALDTETWNELASASIAKLGRDAEGKFSPERFVTAWGKMTPQGKGLLFGGKSDLAKSLNDIATVSSRFKELNRYANPSGTGGTVSVGAMLSGFMVEPFTTAATVLSGRVMAEMLSRPATARSVAKWLEQAEKAARAPKDPTNLESYKRATRYLAFSIARELGVEDQGPRIEKELGAATLPGMIGA